MTPRNLQCPFKVGQDVVYRPSSRGAAHDVMASPSQKLIPGKKYKIKEIQKGAYLVVEGYGHPGGGIYWTEFERGDD